MAVVACDDEEALGEALAALRRTRSLRKDFEFHYTRLNDDLKAAFMAAIADTSLKAVVAVYEKDEMNPKWAWGRDTNLLVQLITHCVLELSAESIKEAKMVIDGEREAKTLQNLLRPALSKALQERGITERLKKIAHGDSGSYDAIQVADMVGGAVNEAAKRETKEIYFRGAVSSNITILKITPGMEKPAK